MNGLPVGPVMVTLALGTTARQVVRFGRTGIKSGSTNRGRSVHTEWYVAGYDKSFGE